MTDPLPLYPGASPCVGSGFCCKLAPCPYGEWNKTKTQCAHLIPIGTASGKHQRYTCGKYEYIVNQPDWQLIPAFGAGCCSTIGNPDRSAIIRELRNSDNLASDLTRHHHQHN